jgi:hypothetical protein
MEKVGPVTEAPRAEASPSYQGTEVVFADVGETGPFEPRPHPLDRVEVGSVGGQPLHAEPVAVSVDPLSHLTGSVGLDAVPEEHDPAPDVVPEVVQEAQHTGGADGSRLEQQE